MDHEVSSVQLKGNGDGGESLLNFGSAAVGVAAGLATGMQVVHFNHFPDEEITSEGAIGIRHASELLRVISGLIEPAPIRT
ncbi:hypothetical protein SAMN04488129_11850 [Halomonas daqiaonensis]|uniref:Uncharacterized protein n=1 Tax=Halomonas daqiaonensis TaxID=650850 RepID=A0A1H7TU26_9GAMM|nr:hypothetical protein SAMN04488129_11850 [Halomonas daqiaonensis]